MKKNRRDKKMVYKRFDLILVIEGPFADEKLWKTLTGKCVLSAGETEIKVGAHRDVPIESLEGGIALVAHSVPIFVPNRKLELSQRLLTVWCEHGTISEKEAARLRMTGDLSCIATVEVHRDKHRETTGLTIRALGQLDVINGDFILVRKPWHDEPLESEFVMRSFRAYMPSRKVQGPSFVPANSTPLGATAVSSSTVTPNEPSASGDSIKVPIDPSTGNVMDYIAPDGTVGCGIGLHDQVILVLREYGRVIKGTKAEMLEEEIGILWGLRNVMHEEETFQAVCAAVDDFDPSAGVLMVSLPDGKTTLMPSSIFPETD